MDRFSLERASKAAQNRRLAYYYCSRATFSLVWVAAALTLGKSMPTVAGGLLLVYPAWGAAANFVDARQRGGLKNNPSQALNVAVSILTALAVAAALGIGMNALLFVYGIWAVAAGLFQLATGTRRWTQFGAQWTLIHSGAQSTFAGTLFIQRAPEPKEPGIADSAPYAGFGAFYFFVSAIWLAVSGMRSRKATFSRP